MMCKHSKSYIGEAAGCLKTLDSDIWTKEFRFSTRNFVDTMHEYEPGRKITTELDSFKPQLRRFPNQSLCPIYKEKVYTVH